MKMSIATISLSGDLVEKLAASFRHAPTRDLEI